jgi:hypothetical protein
MACATALAEAGCSDLEIMAITGDSDPKMVQRYTQNARQRILAKSAISKWERNKG